MNTFKSVLFVAVIMFLMTFFNMESAEAQEFKIYDAVPYVEPIGKPIDVVYHSRFDLVLNDEYEYKGDIVTIDNEFGNRFNPETVIPYTIDLLEKATGIVGMYATLPQNIYGWDYAQKYGLENYKKLNDKYKELLPLVDHLSPVMYNYGRDYYIYWWAKSARWLITESRRLDPSKPIIPYISSDVCLNKECTIIKQLSSKQLSYRIRYLKRMGCAGVVIWASSMTRLEDGSKPKVVPYTISN